MAKLPAPLAPLAALAAARRPAAEYFAPLLQSDDLVLRIGAWCALLERGEITYAQYPALLELCTHAGVRERAFRHFMQFFEYEQAGRVAAIASDERDRTERQAMASALAADEAAQMEALRALFVASGETTRLVELMSLAERSGGWRAALPVAIELMLLNPHDPMVALDLLHLLHESRQGELLEAAVELFEAQSLHPPAAMLYGAAAKLAKGNPGGCLKALANLSTARISRPDVANRLRVTAYELTAAAMEKLGDYRKAYAAYCDMNAVDHGKPIALSDFTDMVTHSAALEVPPLPADPRTDHFVMTGFPRSGTTLLENALAAHPKIETFEEIPTDSSMRIYLDRVLPALPPDADRVPAYLAARQRYYEQMDRLHRKAAATIFVDKMPIRSAEAAFMARLFPDKRYVFSIRHPFDVVLSCFRQRFAPNVAMEHFRTFEAAARLYDFTMRQWFGVFGLEDERVHYVRYDTLVTEFEPTVRGVLHFLGAEWDDAVLGFAKAAEARAARTPSYHKVRQGLSIGVQTAWRHYDFLFQSEAARPLFHWAEFFGYPTR